MSWHGGTVIFKPVCRALVDAVREQKLQGEHAQEILTVLIRELLAQDWGDPEEGLWAFPNKEFVINAFSANGIEDTVCERCGEELDTHCAECGECAEDCACEAEDEYEGEEEGYVPTK